LKKEAVAPDRVVAAFSAYMEHGGDGVSRALFERNLAAKFESPQFTADIGPLLASGHIWDMTEAAQAVTTQLLALLSGEPSKGE
jgi:hypothetical protein